MTDYCLADVLAALVAGLALVCATVIAYHKTSCGNRLKIRELAARIPRVVFVNDIEVVEALNRVLPTIEDQDEGYMAVVAARLRMALSRRGGE